MNWEKIEKVSSLLANFGVLIGIGFLIVELNQNTRATESEAAWSRLEQGSALLERITNDAEFADLYHRFESMEPGDLRNADPVEAERYGRYWSSYLLYWETRYTTQTSPVEHQSLRDNIITHIGDRVLVQRILQVQNARGDRLPEFQAFMMNILDELDSRN